MSLLDLQYICDIVQRVQVSLFPQALAPVGAIFGGPFGGWIADRWGRKCSLMFNGVPYLVGYLILSYAHYAPTATVFKAVLLAGRFMAGLGMGWSSSVCPVSPKLHVVSYVVNYTL